MSLLETAVQVAAQAHAGQNEKNGQPYILHSLRVMARVQTEEEKIVAVLHDVIEDTTWTRAMLAEREFPKHLLDVLECVTHRKGEDSDTLIARAGSNPIARRVKLADLEDNMDIRRLPRITERDRKRLNKYLRAYRWLADADHASHLPASRGSSRDCDEDF